MVEVEAAGAVAAGDEEGEVAPVVEGAGGGGAEVADEGGAADGPGAVGGPDVADDGPLGPEAAHPASTAAASAHAAVASLIRLEFTVMGPPEPDATLGPRFAGRTEALVPIGAGAPSCKLHGRGRPAFTVRAFTEDEADEARR